ncbi:DUF523 domain-containing protein [Peptoniphilus sp.]|jgi:uncharacterized protein YbbK (DUF523 family)|uniref:DUF523 domain-containing protein n=1 Tax=Peptoniphilus sp. TaxID=1971214 RepID=UPI003D8F44A9
MIIVSACLLGENCKYSGGNNLKEEVVEYLKDKDYVAVCPERVFGAPRKPVEIKDGRVVRADGIDVDKEYRKAAEEEFDKIKDMDIEFAILKAKSPTCGVTRIYDGTFSGKLVEGSGIFAEKLKKLGVPLVEK